MDVLAGYESSSSSSSPSSSDSEEQTSIKRKERSSSPEDEKSTKMPKLSSFFETTRTADRFSKNGKTRKVPHLENNWAIHVYCKVDMSFPKEQISKHIKNLNIEEEPHISLSRPLFLKEHQLDSFASLLQKALLKEKHFQIAFAQITQLTNDEKTRSFVTLEIGQGYSELQGILKKVDQTVDQYNLNRFYDPPRFHASLAWGLTEEEVEKEMKNIPEDTMDLLRFDTYFISKVYCKMGNRTVVINLQ